VLFSEFVKIIDTGNLAPVYLLTGEESFLHHQVIHLLSARLIAEGAADFDLEIIDGSDFQYESYINALRSLPLMSPKKLFIIRRLENINSKVLQKAADALTGDLQKIVIVLSYEVKPDFKAKSPLLHLRENYAWIDLSFPRGAEFGKILRWMFKDKKLHPELLAFLSSSKVDLWSIHSWIEQALDYLDGSAEITLADVKNFVDLGGIADIWSFSDALGRKDFKQAQILLNDLLVNREKPKLIVWSLKELFIHLNLIANIRESGRQPERFQKDININQYRYNNYCRLSENYNSAQTERVLQKLQEIDSALVGSGIEFDSLMLEFINAIPRGKEN